jgi:hypothetical protein
VKKERRRKSALGVFALELLPENEASYQTEAEQERQGARLRNF